MAIYWKYKALISPIQEINDAAVLQHEFENDMERMSTWLHERDILILDRGYRDVTELLDNLGITWKIPAFLEGNSEQLSTEQSNDSPLGTKVRWTVEARNGYINSIFKFSKKNSNPAYT